ncbi:hypothetical protein [Bradyrhizobium sp. URHD0069]|uniref:hypothetical protein n=1 Tax=Bradyrhizobium sp. URHD0069 TaxID=1380355 RepID=UPI00049614AB|nr:hypothetical protein [Bradyrhizobium sp. URHD0069]
MRHKLHLSALVAISLIGATTSVFAQGTTGAPVGTVPGTGGMPPVGATPTNPGSAGISSAPGGPSTTTTGMGTGTSTNLNTGVNQPGVPKTSTPDITGTGASPSGLPGDDPAHPDFPGKVGQ